MRQYISSPALGARRALELTSKTFQLTLRNVAVQDVVTLLFHGYMLLRVLAAPDGLEAGVARRVAMGLFLITFTAILLARGEVLPKGCVRSFVYRAGIFCPVLLSYFEMRVLLPALRPELWDGFLLRADLALLHLTPSVALERFNTPRVVEWFAFFYYSYFYILAVMMIPSLIFERGRPLVQCMAGIMVVACLGHTGYTLVPGVGPHAVLAFDQPIQGGFWWQQVLTAVGSAGSQMDIFPSLHTAYPTFFALHAFGNRDRWPYKALWPVLAFFAANIVIATMLLRWHYAIDVVFGLGLALLARHVSVVLWRREQMIAAMDECQPTWEPLFERRRA